MAVHPILLGERGKPGPGRGPMRLLGHCNWILGKWGQKRGSCGRCGRCLELHPHASLSWGVGVYRKASDVLLGTVKEDNSIFGGRYADMTVGLSFTACDTFAVGLLVVQNPGHLPVTPPQPSTRRLVVHPVHAAVAPATISCTPYFTYTLDYECF